MIVELEDKPINQLWISNQFPRPSIKCIILQGRYCQSFKTGYIDFEEMSCINNCDIQYIKFYHNDRCAMQNTRVCCYAIYVLILWMIYFKVGEECSIYWKTAKDCQEVAYRDGRVWQRKRSTCQKEERTFSATHEKQSLWCAVLVIA